MTTKHLYLIVSLAIALDTYCARALHIRTLERNLFQKFNITNGMQDNWIDELNAQLAQFGYRNLYRCSDTNPLFIAHPRLQTALPYISLGSLPTPVEKLENLSAHYGLPIYIKQDSRSGGIDEYGAPIYGGNKVRKLEFLLAQAQALGAQKILTFGCAGSNHAVATAIHARRLGMKPICMLIHQPPSSGVQHNLLMHLNCNTELHYSATPDIRKLNALTVWLDHYKNDGLAPYVIPTGGSNKLGTIGFVNAIFELVAQIEQGLMPKPTHIYVACGSCATTAGILLGCKATGLDAQVVAVAVENNSAFSTTINTLFQETNCYLNTLDSSFPLCSYTLDDLRIDASFVGQGYGVLSPEGAAAAQELLESEKIVLDGTYTAKAFACLLNDIKKEPHAVVLFWNTYSGLDFSAQLTSHDFTNLSMCLHDYFVPQASLNGNQY